MIFHWKQFIQLPSFRLIVIVKNSLINSRQKSRLAMTRCILILNLEKELKSIEIFGTVGDS